MALNRYQRTVTITNPETNQCYKQKLVLLCIKGRKCPSVRLNVTSKTNDQLSIAFGGSVVG
jgi:hypothetical protein